jgi:WD40 repeat protein
VVIFSLDGSCLISGGGEGNGNARVWESRTGKELEGFPQVHGGWIYRIALTQDGRTMASSGADSQMVLWNFATRRPKGDPFTRCDGNAPIAFSASGRWLANAGLDGVPRVWDLDSRQALLLRGHLGGLSSLAFSPDEHLLASGGADATVRVWDPKGRPDANLLAGHRQWVHTVAFSPDSKTLASVDYYQGLVKLWDVATRRWITDLPGMPGDQAAGGVSFSPDGKGIATFSYANKVLSLFDAISHNRLASWTNDFGGANVEFSPDSKLLALATGFALNPRLDSPSLAFWDLEHGRKIDWLSQAAPGAASARFSANGRLVAVGYHDGSVRLWDFSSGRKLAEFHKHSWSVPALAFSRDGAWLASAGYNDATVYNVATLKVAALLPTPAGNKSLAFAPDGKTLAVAGDDGAIRLWNLQTFQPALVLRKHLGAVTGVAFSADGRFMASSGAHFELRLWPAPSFHECEAELSSDK